MSMTMAILALEYLEPEYEETLRCLNQAATDGFDVYFADRDGVGNLSRAFNSSFRLNQLEQYDLVWFVTNVTWQPDVPHKLKATMENTKYAAIHPACASSDHVHLHPVGYPAVLEVPFVEFMAPVFDSEIFGMYMLQEELWYWWMDLVISHKIKKDGGKLACDHTVTVEHNYLRNNRSPHPATTIRKEMRELTREPGQKWLRKEYGANWRQVLNWKE